jgi:acetyl-CoA carboxylase/biotin carboxylase 1
MKMYMPLVATEDGTVQFVKQPGVSLEPGDILGILTLDDPARVKHAKPFEGLLPALGVPNPVGNKPHQRLRYCLDVMGNILDGYDNQSIMAATFKELIDILNDPDLPFDETTTILSTLSGRIPAKLEEGIRALIDSAKGKEGAEFPAARVKKLFESFMLENVRAQDRTMFRAQLSALVDVIEGYTGGAKVHEMNTIASLLEKYESTERLFGGSIEARVLMLREQYKDDTGKVAALVLSHIRAQSKAKLVLTILDYVKTIGLPVNNPDSRLNKVLNDLALLEAKYAHFLFLLLHDS